MGENKRYPALNINLQVVEDNARVMCDLCSGSEPTTCRCCTAFPRGTYPNIIRQELAAYGLYIMPAE